jgi:hypothetical protein
MASRYSIEAVFKATDEFTSPIKKMQEQNKKFTNAFKNGFAQCERAAQNFSNKLKSTLKGIGVGMLAAGGIMTAALIKVGKDAIQLASDLIEVQNVVDVTFGKDADTINKWSKTTLESFGLSELQAKKFSSTLGAMMKSSGLAGDKITRMSMDLAGLAGDMASFYNLDIEEAFNKIRGGLSGETEPLKVLGVDISTTNLQKTFGLDSKQWQSLDAAQKQILRYKYLMKVTKDAQGDFTRTMSDSLANQQRVLKTTIEEMLATLGTVFMPALVRFSNEALNLIKSIDIEDIKTKLEDFVNNIDFEKLIQDIKNVAIDMFNFAKSVISVLQQLRPFLPLLIKIVIALVAFRAAMIIIGYVSMFAKAIQSLAVALKIAQVAQWLLNVAMNANPIALIITAVAALIAIIIVLVKNWDKVKAAITSFAQIFIQFLTLPFKTFIDFLRVGYRGVIAIIDAFKNGGIKEGIMQIGKTLLAFLITPLKNFLNLISKIPGVGNLTSGISNSLNQLQSSLLTPTSKEDRAAATITQRTETTTRGVVEIRDTTGKATMTRPITTQNPQIKFSSSGGF